MVVIRVTKIGGREFLVVCAFVLPVDQIADIWPTHADENGQSVIYMQNRDKFLLNEATSEAFREYLTFL